jgi:hypothetical protein
MKTSLLDKLRKHLAEITPEQFQANWSEIEAMNLGGPSVDDFINSLKMAPAISAIKVLETLDSDCSEEFDCISAENDSCLLAA